MRNQIYRHVDGNLGRLNLFWNRGIHLAPFDIGTIAPIHDIDRAAFAGMLAQFMQRFGGRAPSTAGGFFRQLFDSAVHSNAPHFVNISDIGVERAMFHIGTKAPNGRFDHHPIFGMRANFAGQG